SAVSLARLWSEQGKSADAQAIVAPIYKWFAGGFDAADLAGAKAVLDNLKAVSEAMGARWPRQERWSDRCANPGDDRYSSILPIAPMPGMEPERRESVR